MNVLDIILAIPLAYAVYRGIKDGFVAQLGGLVGILAGIWLAIKFSKETGEWLNMNPDYATEVAFVLIILVTIVLIGIIGWLIGKVFNLVGLGLLNKIGGVAIAIVKTVFILSILLWAFDAVNRKTELVKQENMDKSLLYHPISTLSVYIFPSMEYIRSTFTSSDDE